MIDRFALRGIGRDGVAAHELAEVWCKHPAIGERDAAILVNFLDRDQFAVGQLPVIFAAAIGLQVQPVAAGQGQFLGLANRDPVEVLERYRDANALVAQSTTCVSVMACNRAASPALKPRTLPVEDHHGICIVRPLIALLRVRHVHRLKCRQDCCQPRPPVFAPLKPAASVR